MLRIAIVFSLVAGCFGMDEDSCVRGKHASKGAAGSVLQSVKVDASRRRSMPLKSPAFLECKISCEGKIDPHDEVIYFKVQAVPMDGFAEVISEFNTLNIDSTREAPGSIRPHCISLSKDQYKWLNILCQTEDSSGKVSEWHVLGSSTDGQKRIPIKRATITNMQYLQGIAIGINRLVFSLNYK